MDEKTLAGWVAEGWSLEQIGRRVGRHPSTVSYWLAKYELHAHGRAKHAARGPIEREQLAALVESGASIAEIAETVGRGKATVRHWLKRYDLRTLNGPGRRPRPEVRAARDAGSRAVELECTRHGVSAHAADVRGYFRCVHCRSEAVTRRRRKVKALLVAEFGGSCAQCGYDRSAAALVFHHLDRSTKSFNLAHQGYRRGLEHLRAEAMKCVLLCANCHAEVEGGSVTLSDEHALRAARTDPG
jgi:transposase